MSSLPVSAQKICCPNCGSRAAERQWRATGQTVTECRDCDYLLISCSLTANVLEAYFPGGSRSTAQSGDRMMQPIGSV
jgi:hypothetical protein